MSGGVQANSFGALRLALASLVIVSHTPENIDGNRSREPLTMLFGTLSFGEVAVLGFFLISGYLITASAMSSDLRTFFLRRVTRIYPAFLVCSLICILVIAPVVGGDLSVLDWPRTLLNLVLLMPPEVPGALQGQAVPELNGAMWTIAYEFRCYILAALFGLAGLHLRRRAYVALTLAVLASVALLRHDFGAAVGAMTERTGLSLATGSPVDFAKFLAAFMVGGCFRLYRDALRWDWRMAALSAVGVVAAMTIGRLVAWYGVVLIGSYGLFWLALNTRSAINAREDISYGVYLYAWPATALLLWFTPIEQPVLIGAATALIAWGCGQLSWRLVEAPVVARTKPLAA